MLAIFLVFHMQFMRHGRDKINKEEVEKTRLLTIERQKLRPYIRKLWVPDLSFEACAYLKMSLCFSDMQVPGVFSQDIHFA